MARLKIPLLIILFFMLQLNVNGEVIGRKGQGKSKSESIEKETFFSGLKYRCIGPSRGGRVTAVTGVASAAGTFYMGAVGGGVWKTTDYGQNWNNISDGYFETGSIGAIAVSLSNPDIIYVGTGSDGIRSNVITGRGVYKSIDTGKTWKFIGLRDVGQIGAVLIHPENPDLVYIAAIGSVFGPSPERGVYRSKDGGKTWQQVYFLSNRTGAVDLEFCPTDPMTIYACMWHGERKPWAITSGGAEDGIYKSTDGGDSWRKLTMGLPSGLFGKSDLAVSAADTSRLYVIIEAPKGEGGVYRSDDRGQSFTLVSTERGLLRRPFYYTNIDADPANADILYVNSGRFFKSVDGGKKWKSQRTPHGDNHDMWINPQDSNIFIQANDGGVNVTRDGGKTWSTQNNQPTAELYTVDVDDQFPYWIYAGQQDNSTIMVPSFPPYSPAVGPTAFWRSVGGSETGPAVPKPGNHNIVYANNKGRFGRYNKLTGQEKQYYVGATDIYSHNPRDLKYRFQRVAPIHVSPHDSNIIYHCSQYVHKTTDEGVTWETISPDLTAFEPDKQVISGQPITRDITGEEYYSTIYSIQESPLQKGLIWVGANDGPIHVTRDGGKSWLMVTPADLPSGGRVETIEASPHQPGKAYIAVYRYMLNDWQPYIYRTMDYGKTWQRLSNGSNGIPIDSPTRVVREDPDREGLLYAGTEFGMFVSFDDGANWRKFQLNLPATPITDIKVYRKDLVLSTMGRSFWILDNLTPLHQLNPGIETSKHYLFSPRRAYRMRHRSWRRPEKTDPQYPYPALTIDYYLAKEPSAEIKLEIVNEQGKLIRGFSSKPNKKVPGRLKQIFNKQNLPLERWGTPQLPKKAGMHRFSWDLRVAGSWHANTKRVGIFGPMALPGKYRVKLTIGKWSQSEPFELLIDPRIARDGLSQTDLREQFSLSIKIRDTISQARMAAEFIKNERKALKDKKGKTSRSGQRAKGEDRKLANLEAKFVTAEGWYQTPMLLDQLQYLDYMMKRADQKPGRDAYLRFKELDSRLTGYITELRHIINR